MNRQLFAACVALTLALTVVGCGGTSDSGGETPSTPAAPSSSTTQPPAEAPTTTAPTPTAPTSAANSANLHQVVSYSQSTKDGYTYDVVISMTDWIKGSDDALLSSAWSAVGGKGSLAIPTAGAGGIRGDGGGAMTTNYEPAKAAIAVGKVTLTNTTVGFDLSLDFESMVRLSIKREGSLGKAVCTQYSNGFTCETMGQWLTTSPVRPNAKVAWSFALVVVDAFKPTDPDGANVLDSVLSSPFAPVDTQFTLSKTW